MPAFELPARRRRARRRNHGPDHDRQHRLNEELRESGSWVFTGGLHAPGSATVVRAGGMTTDGP